jgi:hypothetical protein
LPAGQAAGGTKDDKYQQLWLQMQKMSQGFHFAIDRGEISPGPIGGIGFPV